MSRPLRIKIVAPASYQIAGEHVVLRFDADHRDDMLAALQLQEAERITIRANTHPELRTMLERVHEFLSLRDLGMPANQLRLDINYLLTRVQP